MHLMHSIQVNTLRSKDCTTEAVKQAIRVNIYRPYWTLRGYIYRG